MLKEFVDWLMVLWDDSTKQHGSLVVEGIPDTLSLDGWVLLNIGEEIMPKQKNGFDCGMFCIRTVEALLQHCSLDFQQVLSTKTLSNY